MNFKISSDTVGTQWQLGDTRVDAKPAWTKGIIWHTSYNLKHLILALPKIEYSEDQQNQLQNQLRLYFTQLDKAHLDEIKNLHTNNVMHWMGIIMSGEFHRTNRS